MRTGWKLTVTAFGVATSLVLVSCGGSDDEVATATTPVTVATTTTLAPATTTTVATTAPPTTAATTTTTAAPTTTVFSGPGAPEQLAAFLGAYDVLTERLPGLYDEVQAELDASGAVSDDLNDRTADAGGDVFDLTLFVPLGLDPSVYAAAHDAVMMAAAATSAFIYAPGWDAAEWPDWKAGMEAAQQQMGSMRALLEGAASSAPGMRSVDPASREAAAGAVLELEVGRRFGHGGPGAEVDAPVPFVHWAGALVDGEANGTACYLDLASGEPRALEGEFEDGVGGCAVVFWEGQDHPEEIDAWNAAPGEQYPTGEFVAVVFIDGGWEAIGSVE